MNLEVGNLVKRRGEMPVKDIFRVEKYNGADRYNLKCISGEKKGRRWLDIHEAHLEIIKIGELK